MDTQFFTKEVEKIDDNQTDYRGFPGAVHGGRTDRLLR